MNPDSVLHALDEELRKEFHRLRRDGQMRKLLIGRHAVVRDEFQPMRGQVFVELFEFDRVTSDAGASAAAASECSAADAFVTEPPPGSEHGAGFVASLDFLLLLALLSPV